MASVVAVNNARTIYRFGEVSDKHPFYGCEFYIDKSMRRVEPSELVKGTVARAHLFMASHYHLKLSKAQRQLLNSWNNLFPPSAWELQWAQMIAKLEGYDNAYIKN